MKQFYKKNFFLITAFLIIALFSNRSGYSQTSGNTWQLLKENSGVKAYYMISTCGAQEFVHLKVQNSNATAKNVIWMGNVKNNQGISAALPTMSPKGLQGGEEILSDCANPSQILSLPVQSGFIVSDLNVNLIVLP